MKYSLPPNAGPASVVTSLGAVIEDALRREFAAAHVGGARPTVPVFDGGTGPRRGIDLTSNRALSEVLDEGLELNSRK
ncbi:hypothetical protein J114_03990 [Mycobacterium tuberculosis EAI5/NITR206]|nr:hypothetical protein J114_03990 [Mycobacterium tuberculosis EAI5/NITR206]